MLIMKKENMFKLPALIVSVMLLFTACSKDKEIIFCEGVSPDGEGVNCGTLFEYGDVTAIIKSRERFGAGEISVKVDLIRDRKNVTVETIKTGVEPDERKAIVNIPLYNSGRYEVSAARGEDVLAKGRVEVAE